MFCKNVKSKSLGSKSGGSKSYEAKSVESKSFDSKSTDHKYAYSESTGTFSVASSSVVGDHIECPGECDLAYLDDHHDDDEKYVVGVGDFLPYGPRMFYETCDNPVRMKDIGDKNRILVLGVLGSYTPDCWNRHLFKVLQKLKYYEDRDVDYICCISTNDAFVQKSWGKFLGCSENILMWSDSTKRYTKALGMDIVIPWLDNTIRSKRYVLLADDMEVTKLCMSPNDSPDMKWECEHMHVQTDDEGSDESEES